MEPLDLTSLQPYKAQASSAANEAANLASSTPSLLQQLQSNLTSIFAKDNPYIAERGKALETFLNAPSQSRVSTLPQNLPTVEGSNLNLSPTQQNAITTARQNAALVPLAGLNQLVTGLYGNIPGIVQGAGDIYSAQTRAAELRSQMAQQQYQNALQELLEAEKTRQFNVKESRLGQTSGGDGLDSLSQLLLGQLAGGSQTISLDNLIEDDINQFGGVGDQSYGPSIPQISIPGQTGTIQAYSPAPVSGGGGWDWLKGLFSGWGGSPQQAAPTSISQTGLGTSSGLGTSLGIGGYR